MAAVLKKNASPEFIRKMKELEDRSDECYESLDVFARPGNLALWIALTGVIDWLEEKLNKEPQNFMTALLNLGRTASLLTRWSRQSTAANASIHKFHWQESFTRLGREAAEAAFNYLAFVGCFTAWHNNYYAAEIVNEGTIRFEVLDFGSEERRVSAYQKGIRPSRAGRPTTDGVTPPDAVKQIQDRVIQRCKRVQRDPLEFRYHSPEPAYTALYPLYYDRLTALFRRDDGLDLGGYTLAEYKQFYSALCSVCALHEHTCFRLGRSGRYPFTSATLVKSTAEWAALLSTIAKLDESKTAKIIASLTLPLKTELSWLDLHVCPFVPLDASSNALALIPHFPLNSRADENILRICSYLRPDIYDIASSNKSSEMYADLRPSLPKTFTVREAVALPDPLPDIDLVLVDEGSATVLAAELKWLRKPYFVAERMRQDEEFWKGVDQVSKVSSFLKANPQFLRDRGVTRNPLGEYAVYHVLIARDHLLWVEPGRCPVFAYDAFKEALKDNDLRKAIQSLLKFDWLPTEGTDFVTREVDYTANGITILHATTFPVA